MFGLELTNCQRGLFAFSNRATVRAHADGSNCDCARDTSVLIVRARAHLCMRGFGAHCDCALAVLNLSRGCVREGKRSRSQAEQKCRGREAMRAARSPQQRTWFAKHISEDKETKVEAVNRHGGGKAST